MAKLVSDLGELASDVAQAAANILPKRRVALITGITGQVRLDRYRIEEEFF